MRYRQVRFKWFFIWFGFILLSSLNVIAEEKTEYELSEELVDYIEFAYKAAETRTEVEWNEMIQDVTSLLEQGANPDIYFHSVRGTALSVSLFPFVLEPLFFAIAPYSKNLNMPHYKKQLPIETAVRKRNIPVIKYLVANGTDLKAEHCCFHNGKTPIIHFALSSKDIELFTLLLDLGADVNAEVFSGNLLKRSILSGKYEITKLLIDRGANGADHSVLHDAIRRSAPVTILQSLVDIGYGPWSEDERGESAIEYAKKLKNTSAVKFLEQYIHTPSK
jgi:ankyrin repeat protein